MRSVVLVFLGGQLVTALLGVPYLPDHLVVPAVVKHKVRAFFETKGTELSTGQDGSNY